MHASTKQGDAELAEQRRHIVLYSSGRSGSNRLLDFFDQHEMTNCRNEIDRSDPLFNKLCDDSRECLPANVLVSWQTAVKRATLRKGADDRFTLGHKAYLKAILGIAWSQIARRRRVRRAFLGIADDEWPIPRQILRENARNDVIPVIKLMGPPQLVVAAHEGDETQIVIHNIRDPRDYLASWYNRFALVKFGDNLEPLYEIVRGKALVWSRVIRDDLQLPERFSLKSLLVAELWLWRATNEPLLARLKHSPRYRLVTYNELSSSREDTARSLYAHAGLDFRKRHADRIRSLENTLFREGHREKLDDGVISEAVDVALSDSILKQFVRPPDQNKNTEPSVSKPLEARP